ncbi:unnamed protein product [Rangifer tarandus platyrhynchus]|uniref:Uncharacterized protein n=1 Tax=Rangifer tarandus platyrhynchus TaxID=3082113 RepID=A0AC59YXF0_RANTA
MGVRGADRATASSTRACFLCRTLQAPPTPRTSAHVAAPRRFPASLPAPSSLRVPGPVGPAGPPPHPHRPSPALARLPPAAYPGPS